MEKKVRLWAQNSKADHLCTSTHFRTQINNDAEDTYTGAAHNKAIQNDKTWPICESIV